MEQAHGIAAFDDVQVVVLVKDGESEVALHSLRHPELLGEWDYKKNINIAPDSITCGSGKKIWWKCKKGHKSWQAQISSRLKGCGCPVCGYEKIRRSQYKRVAQFDLRGRLIREWDGASLAQKTLGIKHISSVCNGHRRTAGGFVWKYVKSSE